MRLSDVDIHEVCAVLSHHPLEWTVVDHVDARTIFIKKIRVPMPIGIDRGPPVPFGDDGGIRPEFSKHYYTTTSPPPGGGYLPTYYYHFVHQQDQLDVYASIYWLHTRFPNAEIDIVLCMHPLELARVPLKEIAEENEE